MDKSKNSHTDVLRFICGYVVGAGLALIYLWVSQAN